MINVREIACRPFVGPGFTSVHKPVGTTGPGDLPKIAVIVISAGPNRTIETSAEQQFNDFALQATTSYSELSD